MNYKTKIRDFIIFSFLGVLLFLGKMIFEPLPNIHPIGALVMVYTLVYRGRALIPIYIFVFLQLFISGFSLWLMPYIYVWTVLWAMTMLLPKNMPLKIQGLVFPIVCALHGLLFGILYAPMQAILFRMDFPTMLKWIVAGSLFDMVHAAGNLAAGFLVLPLTLVLKRLSEK